MSAVNGGPRADAPADCRHCGLPIPGVRQQRHDEFCCDGCARVHDLLLGEGLDRYYDLRGEHGTPPAELRDSGMAWLDPLLAGEAERVAGVRTLRLDLQGVHCAACVWLLRELFLRWEGAVDLRVNPASGGAELTFRPACFDARGYLAEVERFGYRFGPPRTVRAPRSRSLLLRLGVCAAAAGNVMLFSFSLYAGLGRSEGALYALFGWLSLTLTAVAVAAGGWVFFRAALVGLRLGVVHLDLPIALGIVLAFAGSVYAHLAHGAQHAFYDTVAIFVTLMLLGRFLQERVLERNRAAVLGADGLETLTVRRVAGGGIESVRAAAITTGDELLVVPGDLVPVAGVVLGGAGAVALDWISGEPDVLQVAAGDGVAAGAINAGHTGLRLAASEPFTASRLHELLGRPAADVEAPLGPAGAWWHTLGTVYVVAVLALAAAGLLLWLPRGAEAALEVTIAILVVTCPCAIGLAVPLAHELVHVALRRAGIFLRRQSFLDRALRVRTVLFDKTGTLTRGRLALLPEALAALAALPAETRAVAAAMASRSNHPASRALAAALGDAAPAAVADPSLLEELPGQGMRWARGMAEWRLGRPEFAAPGEASARPAVGGETWLARDGVPVARLAFAEEVRADVPDELARLAAAGLEVRVLSGDHPERVRELARRIGLREECVEGGLSPEAKAARVREIDRRDTLMVGDGINDAPSFAVAFCTATPAVDRPHLPARADLYYLGDGVAAVARALAAAVRLRRVVWANLAFAFAYNAVALTLAFAGLVTPLLAAVLMPASSLTVVGHTIARTAGRRWLWRS